jgi:holin-like protein
MLSGLVRILLFQGLGELVSHFIVPLIPGPVIGLLMLLGWLAFKRGVPDDLAVVAGSLVQHLGLLFVPAAVGVVMFLPHLQSHALAVVAALVASSILTIAVTAIVLRLLASDAQ